MSPRTHRASRAPTRRARRGSCHPRYLDVNGLRLTGRRFGVGRYIEYLLRYWTDLDEAFGGVRLFTPRPIDDPVDIASFVEHRVIGTRRSNAYWEQVLLARSHRASDVLFCPSYVTPLAARGKVVVTHLGSYEALPEAFPLRDRLKARVLYQLSARRADLVITVSESSKRDIVRYYGVSPDKVTVIPLGVDPQFRPIRDSAELAASRRALLGSDRPFVLFVGKLTARRNIPQLIDAFGQLKRDLALPHSLVLIGQNTSGHDLSALAERSGLALERDLVHREFVGHDKLVGIYNAADLFVYPSSYEGFGIPVLEAMACAVPSVTLRNSAFLEFAEGAYLCDEGSVEQLCRGMRAVLTSPDLRGRLAHAGRRRSRDFLWDGIARRTMDTLAAVAAA